MTKLVKIYKSRVSGFIFIIDLFDLGRYKKLVEKVYKVEKSIDILGR